MIGVVVAVQTIVIIWLFVLLHITNGDLKKRIDRASRHLEATDKPEDPKPICGCQHHQCFHDDTGCKHVESKYSSEGDWDAFECSCLRYVGPEALPTVLP